YATGENIELGDVVLIPVPNGSARMKVVMLGDTQQHSELQSTFLKWVTTERKLEDDEVVLEWIDKNPFEHKDPNVAPVGKYMFSGADQYLVLVERNPASETHT
ncbi:MAG: hypothetical protein KDA57_24190, partial [Planctomycetales bacterium]|nr:hypothetical protein [Planctomycetales bacterium]